MTKKDKIVLEVESSGAVYDAAGIYVGTATLPLQGFDNEQPVSTSTIEKLAHAGLSAEDIVLLRKGGVI